MGPAVANGDVPSDTDSPDDAAGNTQ